MSVFKMKITTKAILSILAILCIISTPVLASGNENPFNVTQSQTQTPSLDSGQNQSLNSTQNQTVAQTTQGKFSLRNVMGLALGKLKKAAIPFTSMPTRVQEKIMSKTNNTSESPIHSIWNRLRSQQEVSDQQYWSNLQQEFPVNSSGKFISKSEGGCEKLYNYVPVGTTLLTVIDDDGKILQTYIVDKQDLGINLKTGLTTEANQEYTVTLDQLKDYERSYGKLAPIQACRLSISQSFN